MSATSASILPAEAEHFGRLAADWWNPKGSSAMLHRLNPARLRYVREQLDLLWGLDPRDRRPLAGKRVLDVGCGAGLLSEPLARLGAATTGLDAAPENIAAAKVHADAQGLTIDYRGGGIEALAGGAFDLIAAMEVIEHVADPADFLRGLAGALAPSGVLILSTPNRTPLSKLAMIEIGENLGFVPKNTHDWQRFLKPDELVGLASAAGLKAIDRRGLSFNPMRGFSLSDDLSLDYFVTLRHAAA